MLPHVTDCTKVNGTLKVLDLRDKQIVDRSGGLGAVFESSSLELLHLNATNRRRCSGALAGVPLTTDGHSPADRTLTSESHRAELVGLTDQPINVGAARSWLVYETNQFSTTTLGHSPRVDWSRGPYSRSTIQLVGHGPIG